MHDDAVADLPGGVIEFDGHAAPSPRCDGCEYAIDNWGVRYRRGIQSLKSSRTGTPSASAIWKTLSMLMLCRNAAGARTPLAVRGP